MPPFCRLLFAAALPCCSSIQGDYYITYIPRYQLLVFKYQPTFLTQILEKRIFLPSLKEKYQNYIYSTFSLVRSWWTHCRLYTVFSLVRRHKSRPSPDNMAIDITYIFKNIPVFIFSHNYHSVHKTAVVVTSALVNRYKINALLLVRYCPQRVGRFVFM